jgi:hypothetical protein
VVRLLLGAGKPDQEAEAAGAGSSHHSQGPGLHADSHRAGSILPSEKESGEGEKGGPLSKWRFSKLGFYQIFCRLKALGVGGSWASLVPLGQEQGHLLFKASL